MIIDAQLLYSDAQALTATAASTNVIDHGQDRNLGQGEPLVAVITIDVALGGTSPTFVATLQTDDNAAFSSPVTVGATPSQAAAAAGTKFFIPLPPDTGAERFTRISYTLGGTSPTATVTSFLQPAHMVGAGEGVYYADAITIG